MSGYGAMIGCMVLALTACSGGADWHRVERARVEYSVEATGQLVSSDTAVLMPPVVKNTWNFTIAFMAPEGSVVAAGMPVLGFDDKQVADQLQQRRGELEEKRREAERATLTHAQTAQDDALELARLASESERATRKAEQPADAVAGLEYRKLQIDAQRAQRVLELYRLRMAQSARARALERELLESELQRLGLEVQRLEAELARFRVAAPRAGMVIHRNNWEGNKLIVGQQVWLGQEVMEIPDLGRMRARVQIPEREAARVRLGQVARIRLEAARDRVFSGRIVSLGDVFRQKSETQPAVVFDAEIEIDAPDPGLMRPGMAATAEIVIGVDASVLRLPRRAVSMRDGQPVATRRGLLGEATVPLVLSAQAGEWFVIESGLVEGDEVRL